MNGNMNINFKYQVWLRSLIGASDHRVEVFTETVLYDEFLQAVSSVASDNWEILSYNICWQEQF